MAKIKFNIGDKVVISDRCPEELRSKIRGNRVRTIKHRYYDPKRKCAYLYLGYNYRGASHDLEAYPFRTYMLKPTIRGRRSGRPKTKRAYTTKGGKR